jgi:uncharacterized protein (TIGR03437 family)
VKLTQQFELVYSTLIGGSGTDSVGAVAVDNVGRLYLTGTTSSSDFVVVRAIYPTAPASSSAFVTRLGPSGLPEYSTYLGRYLKGLAIAADETGAAYIGCSRNESSNLIGSESGIIGKIAPDGSSFVWRLNFSSSESLYCLRLDASHALHVVGEGRLNPLPRSMFTGPQIWGGTYHIVISPDGKTIDTKATRRPSILESAPRTLGDLEFGGAIRAIALDGKGNSYWAATMEDDGNWPSPNGFQRYEWDRSGTGNAYIAKADIAKPGLGVVQWATYLRGSKYENAYLIDVDNNGSIYVAGLTNSTDFPSLNAAGQFEPAGGSEIWFAKIEESTAACSITVRSDRGSVSGNGGEGRFQVFTNRPECQWRAIPEQGWIRITQGTSGTGFGVVSYHADTNFEGQRSAAIRVENSVHVVYQTANSCSYFLPSTRRSVSATGDNVVVSVQTSDSCDWPLSTSESWITWPTTLRARGNGSVSLTIAANSGPPRTGAVNIGGQPFAISQGAAEAGGSPFIVAAGLLNAASYEGGRVAPAEVLTLYGLRLGPEQLTFAGLTGDAFPTELAGVRVWFGDRAVPLIYASKDQLAMITPSNIAPPADVEITVEYQGAKSLPIRLPVARAIPGLFSADSSGRGQAAALNENASINGAGNPAAAGSIVVLFGTGFGAMDGHITDGALALSQHLPKLTEPVSVTIGGRAAEVLYAGQAPSLVYGVIQLNVRIPSGLASGAQPVTVRVGSSPSQTNLTVSVK